MDERPAESQSPSIVSTRRPRDTYHYQCVRCGKTVLAPQPLLHGPVVQRGRRFSPGRPSHTGVPLGAWLRELDALRKRACALSDTVRHVAAGAAARTMSQFVIHPLDTVKTRLQINKNTAVEQLRTWRRTSKKVPLDLYLGRRRVVHLRNVIYRGPKDLYLGVCGAVLGTLPTAAVYFATYEWCKSQLEARHCSSALCHISSATAGAVLSAFVKVPSDTLKHQVQAYLFPNVWQGAHGIVKQEGIAGLYHGLLPTMMRDVPELAIQFLLYERLRQALEHHRGVKKLRTYEHLGIGALSGACAATATTPLDCAKTALQCGARASLGEVLSCIVREHGAHGLFAGMGPRVAQTAIMSAVFFTLFEVWKGQLKRERLPEDCMAPKIWRKRRGHVWKRQFVSA